MKVIIAGGRDFYDYGSLYRYCDYVLLNQTDIEVVSGCANGADSLGERYAKEKGYPIKKFKADWNKFNKSAGFKRNAEMAEYADALIVFWDRKSKGTKNMIELATNKKLKLRIFEYNVPKKFTKEQFDEFVGEMLPSALFHVMPTDIDSLICIRCDELILLQMLSACPEVLRYKSLSWFVEKFITNFDKGIKNV
jgi:hypothetical protein